MEIGTVVFFGHSGQFFKALEEALASQGGIHMEYESDLTGLAITLGHIPRSFREIVLIVEDQFCYTSDPVDMIDAPNGNLIQAIRILPQFIEKYRGLGYTGPVIALADTKVATDRLMEAGCTHRADRLLVDDQSYQRREKPPTDGWELNDLLKTLAEGILAIIDEYPQPQGEILTEEMAEAYYALLPRTSPRRNPGETAIQFFRRIGALPAI